MHDWLLLQQGFWLYFMIFAALMGGALGLPIPEDIPLIIAGVVAHQGNADVYLLFLVCYAAIVLGDVVIFMIGRRLGPTLFNKAWFKSRVSTQRIKGVRFNLERRSLLMIFIARHLFYLRTVTFLVCGAVRMDFARFLVADMIAALVSVPLMMFLGYMGSEHFDAVMSFIISMKNWSLLAGLIALLGITYYYFVHYRRRKISPAPMEENEESHF